MQSRNVIMKRLKELGEERTVLIHKLQRSFALQHIWPRVFEDGSEKVRSGFRGNPNNASIRLKFEVHSASGEKRDYDYTEVPSILWPKSLHKTAQYRVRLKIEEKGGHKNV